MQVQDQIAIVTGGASGLGEATARALAAAGARVAVLDRQLDKAKVKLRQLAGKNIDLLDSLYPITPLEDVVKKAASEDVPLQTPEVQPEIIPAGSEADAPSDKK